MKITKLNRTHNVTKNTDAKWQAKFATSEAYMEAVITMYQAFGPGSPYMNGREDAGKKWMFRNRDCSRINHDNKNHLLYLTTEEQITLLTLSYKEDD